MAYARLEERADADADAAAELDASLSLGAIARASLPAILNNVAAPLAAAAQLSCVGFSSAAATPTVAAYAATNAVITFVASVANFVIVVTMAKAGHALGARRWDELWLTVLSALAAATAVGAACALALWLLRQRVLDATSAYWPYAVLRLPPLLLLRAASGALVGFQHLGVASALNALAAAADALAFFALLVTAAAGLPAAGAAVAATSALATEAARAELRRCRCTGVPAASTVELGCASFDVLLRSVLLSGSVLSLTFAVAPLGPAALAAHAVLLQLWMVASYAADGLADVGTMLGSRLLGAGQTARMRTLTRHLAALGVAGGVGLALLLAAGREAIIRAFTRDEASIALLAAAWPLLCAVTPVNAIVFVYDGLLYATQSFKFIRNALALGVGLIFAPALALVVSVHHTLLAVWMAKVALNVWRCSTALFRIHGQLWKSW
eukprot:CAMPEP_0195597438 /NCGR_PEP_ID=MMETSP0815-20121206/2986_1 /TAXON_ID=97485 /ORGANISM="Prymnesium parvum, Strain Texoma1" /LENGTH=440 /DNA_ID=CAMNT_0040736781 /DNA_START=7 /DNA_END=1329 /DNA_ORIENTATION=+